MILNIIERRKNPYRWKHIDAIIEPTWHDNSCSNSDQAERDDSGPEYAERISVSLADAIEGASEVAVPMTLYMYDKGSKDSF